MLRPWPSRRPKADCDSLGRQSGSGDFVSGWSRSSGVQGIPLKLLGVGLTRIGKAKFGLAHGSALNPISVSSSESQGAANSGFTKNEIHKIRHARPEGTSDSYIKSDIYNEKRKAQSRVLGFVPFWLCGFVTFFLRSFLRKQRA